MINTEILSEIFSGTDEVVATYFFGLQVKGKTDIIIEWIQRKSIKS